MLGFKEYLEEAAVAEAEAEAGDAPKADEA